MAHPFDPATPAELTAAVKVLEEAYPGVPLRYKAVDVQEPIKKDVIPYIEAERLCKPLPTKPARLLMALFHRMDTKSFLKAIVNVDTRSIVRVTEIPPGVQGPADIDELVEMESLCLTHPSVLAEIEKLKLPPGITVCTDPWIYGTEIEGETRRLFQFYLYFIDTDDPQHNHYSLPCTISPVFDCMTKELVRIDSLPTGSDHTSKPTQPWTPRKAVQYAHNLLEEPMRTDLKPYIVQQPEGPSFSVDGSEVYWQKWRFRVGFNYREGMVLYGVTYDRRNLFYRLAVNEMTVPYGDPRAPYHRKQAFDAGDVGFGIAANTLSLGCDCLGHIKYFDAYRTDSKGHPVLLKNVLCLHEQDNGLQHKHTNYRTQASTTVRNRQLVLQMICTVANYEYIFAWIFDQAGSIELEIRATGILSTTPIDDGASVPFGTRVAPGVMAPFHQHIFNLRIDPAIDGFDNTVVYQDSVAMADDPTLNPYGVGYVQETTVVKRSTAADLSVADARVFKIRNDGVVNGVSGRAVAYKLVAVPSQLMLMHPRSYNRRRAQFATRAVWVTKYREGELYAAGEFTNQSRQSSGVEEWVEREDEVENTDVVLWHTYSLDGKSLTIAAFAVTHNPRPEDFPVMPMERVSVMLRPDGFFERNPALDVPPSSLSFNRSTAVVVHR